MDKNVLAVICARGGSKGLPKKNIADLCGKPLIWHTIQQAANAKTLSRVLISTDSPEIADVAKQYAPHWVQFLRPSELATDESKIEEAVIHALTFAENTTKMSYNYIVVLPNSSVLRSSADIDAAVHLLDKNKFADVVMSVVEIEHPYELMRKRDGYVRPLPEYRGIYRRQDCKPLYLANGAVRVVKRDQLLHYGSMYGEIIVPYVMPQHRSLEIHSDDDLLIAEALLCLRS